MSTDAMAGQLDTCNTARAALRSRRSLAYDFALHCSPMRAATDPVVNAAAAKAQTMALIDQAEAIAVCAAAEPGANVAAAEAQAVALIDQAEARAEAARGWVRANERMAGSRIEKADASASRVSACSIRQVLEDYAEAEAHALVDKAEAAERRTKIVGEGLGSLIDRLRRENAILAERVAVAEARASQAEARAAVAEAQAEALQRQVRAGVSRVWELVEADAVREMGEKWRERDTVASHADEPPHSVTAVDALALRASIKGFDEALASWRGEIARVQLRGSEPGSAVGVGGLGEGSL